MKICIDAGHGGNDSGCSGFGKVEKNLNLEYAIMLRNELLKYENVEIVMTRTNDISLSLNERCNIANNNHCDLFLSCHINACDSIARGTEVIYSIHSSQEFINFCSYMCKCLSSKLGVPFRRIFSRKSTDGNGDYYTVINNTNMKAIIIEPLFLDNKDDNNKYNPYILSETITKAIADNYCLKLKQNIIVYKNGMQNDAVKTIQAKLNQFLESLRLNIDGNFGNMTEHIVKLYQQEHGLKVDGIVGPETQKSLGLN